jgi:hypothetical protein
MQNHLAAENTHLAETQAAMRSRHSGTEKASANVVDPSMRPYSVDDLMKLHGLSRQTIISLYENERGVQIIENTARQQSGVRRHRTLRIPRHVYRRVCQRIEVK